MGANIPLPLLSAPVNLSNNYTEGASTGYFDVGANDDISLLVSVTQSTLTELTMRVLTKVEEDNEDFVFCKVEDGAVSVEEITNTFGPTKFALRLDTRGVKEIRVDFKGDAAAGTLNGVWVSREGSATATPRNLP